MAIHVGMIHDDIKSDPKRSKLFDTLKGTYSSFLLLRGFAN